MKLFLGGDLMLGRGIDQILPRPADPTLYEPEPDKDIHYRMTPANKAVLAAARLDVCALANNHVLDWWALGLSDTLDTLGSMGIGAAGAGKDAEAARTPAIVSCQGAGHVRVVSVAEGASGVPESWEATSARPGVWRLPDLSAQIAGAAHRGGPGLAALDHGVALPPLWPRGSLGRWTGADLVLAWVSHVRRRSARPAEPAPRAASRARPCR